MAVGVWHTLFGLWWFAAPLARVARGGAWGAVGWSTDGRALAFWFLAAGAFALLAGGLVDYLETHGGPLPEWLGWGLVSVALVGGVAIPVSGFWLLAVPGAGVLRRSAGRGRRGSRRAGA